MSSRSPVRQSSDTLPVERSLNMNEKTAGPPAIPFQWPTGWKRVHLWLWVPLSLLEVLVLPLVLFYALYYGTTASNQLIFGLITGLWGLNFYVSLSIRSWKLFRNPKYRPLGQSSKWAFDFTSWFAFFGCTAAVALLAIGTIPTAVWIRVTAMATPALMLAFSGTSMVVLTWHLMHLRAPFRLSSTARGGVVLPTAYYILEDVLAVDSNGERPVRDAIAARYAASPRFRTMLLTQTLFWTLPMFWLGAGLTVVAVLHEVPRSVAWGVCSGVPWVWAMVWAFLTWMMVRRDLQHERVEWPHRIRA